MSTIHDHLDFLTEDELQKVTLRKKFRAQKRMLDQMRIPYIDHPDGKLLVLRSNVLRKFGIVEQAQRAKNKPQPNFDQL
jgi:hypothetical protein